MKEVEQDVTNRIIASDRKRVLHNLLLAVGFMVAQTVLIFGVAGVLVRSSENLAARVDRNLTFTACVLSFHPSLRTDKNIIDCYKKATDLYPGLKPPLPMPDLTPIVKGN